MLVRSVLFPVDFSPHCRLVTNVVADFARRFGAEVTVLHALDLPPGAYADWIAFLNLVDLENVKAHLRRQLEWFGREQFAGVDVRRVLVDGSAGPAIAEYAKAHGVDAVMMPTRGLNKFRELLLGSVTAHVLHEAECPVWTEAHNAMEVEPAAEFRKILCAVDLSHASEGVFEWAKQVAAGYGATLRVAHVIEKGGAEAEIRARQRWSAFADGWDIEIRTGHVSEEICAAAKEHESDLMVIGRGAIREKLGRFRSHAQAIIRKSPCAVWSV
ncbi:MAG: universal stress protein [Bryobacterales bacterium]|nr:universal stress protein [Bryobacterales bacterium]